MEGAGSDGAATAKFAAYGMTKAGIPQLTASLAAELQGSRVRACSISPGMVYTELLSAGRDAFGAQGRFFVNAIAEPAEAHGTRAPRARFPRARAASVAGRPSPRAA